MNQFGRSNTYGIDNHGLRNLRSVYWNYSPPALVEEAICRREGQLSKTGALIVNTGQHTGRSPKDKYIVKNGVQEDNLIWWGKINQPIKEEQFNRLYTKLIGYLQGRDVFIQDMYVGAHPDFRMPIRVITEKAWHSLFAYDLFIRVPLEEQKLHRPEFTLIDCPDFVADPQTDGVRSGTFIVVNFASRLVLIGGTSYAGEIKKSIFTIMNYILPLKGVVSMHCSANVGAGDDVALFFGLSGTGKTTLSSDPERRLIGDDEHGWSDAGVFNFEGGCYAKTIRLRADLEPIIWEATHRFGAVLENVIYDSHTREIDFDSEERTENTRGAYPIDYVANRVAEGFAGHPKNIFFLSADAFGVLPPISRLTPEQAMYYFLSGYTAKLAGTEKGLGNEPQATFSTCFGAPFLPLNPSVYVELLGKKIQQHNVQVWLVNTGWTGGEYGVGKRVPLPFTRAMIRAALSGKLANVPMQQEPFFGLWVPEYCPDVPSDILLPQATWQDGNAYATQAKHLIEQFKKNFVECGSGVSSAIVAAGPHYT